MKAKFAFLFLLFFSTYCESKPAPKSKQSPAIFQEATFAGGCFWCSQPVFDHIQGVIKTEVGFSGGTEMDATYETVSSGKTGHAEAVNVTFDPLLTTYEKILDQYWKSIDPTDDGGQFADRGSQYRTVIFYRNEEQKKFAIESKLILEKSKKFSKPIQVTIEPFGLFVPVKGKEAEDHDQYYKKNPIRYKLYEKGSGREDFLKKYNP